MLRVGTPWPTGPLRAPADFELALYPTSDGHEDPVAVVKRQVEATPGFTWSSAEDAERPAVDAATVAVDAYGPSLDALAPATVAHLTGAERARLHQVKRVTFVSFRGLTPDQLAGAERLTHRAAQEVGALVLDPETSEFFSEASFAAARLEPGGDRLAREVVVRATGTRMVTAGMGKLGLPDLGIDDPRVAAAPDEVHALLELAAHALDSRGALTRTGKLELDGGAALDATVGAHLEGDAENRLMQLQLRPADGGA